MRTVYASTMISHPPVSTRPPALKAITRPMARIVPATANGKVAVTSSRLVQTERVRASTQPTGTPMKAAAQAASVANSSVLASGPPGGCEQLRIVSQTEGSMQHRPAELHERQRDNGKERHERQQHDGPGIGRRHDAPAGADPDQRRGYARAGRKAPAGQIAPLDDQNRRRQDDQQNAQYAGRGGIGRRFADEELVGLHRRGSACLRPAPPARRNSRMSR